jgi:hypothetical protein
MDQPQQSTTRFPARPHTTPVRTDELDRVILKHVTDILTLAPEDNWQLSYVRIPRYVDEELGADYEVMRLYVAEQPRKLDDKPATWLVEALRKSHPDHFAWQSLGDELIWQKGDKSFRGGETEAEIALFILINTHGANGKSTERFLDEHCVGWVDDESLGTILVSDLYVVDEDVLAAVQNFVYEAGLHFKITGATWHHPSRTVRLSIWKEKQ